MRKQKKNISGAPKYAWIHSIISIKNTAEQKSGWTSHSFFGIFALYYTSFWNVFYNFFSLILSFIEMIYECYYACFRVWVSIGMIQSTHYELVDEIQWCWIYMMINFPIEWRTQCKWHIYDTIYISIKYVFFCLQGTYEKKTTTTTKYENFPLPNIA